MDDPQKGQTRQTSQGQQTKPQVAPPTPKVKEREAAGAVPKWPPADLVPPVDLGVAGKIAKEEGDEYWENYAREIELEKEIEELGGIQKVESGEVVVPEEVAKEMGVKPAVTVQTPMEKVTGFSVRGVSLSDDQLTAGLAKPTSSGLRWLVEWFIYQLLKARFLIKRIGGKITRQKSS